MSEKMKWELKAKGPVCEQTFLEYLDKVCKEDDLKGYILEFYEKLKEEDKKDGSIICKESFGKPEKIFLNGQVFDYDFNKYLFANGEKIGKADFFRYQFLNFVDNVYYRVDRETRAGCCDLIEKSVILNTLVIEKKENTILRKNKSYFEQLLRNEISEDEYDKKYCSQESIATVINKYKKDIMFHELTHILSMKTLNDGRLIEVYSPRDIRMCNGDKRVLLSRPINVCKEIRRAYISGIGIVGEIFTDISSSHYCTNIKEKCVNKNLYDLSPKYELARPYYLNKLKVPEYLGYVRFSDFVKMFGMFGVFDQSEKYLHNQSLLSQQFFTESYCYLKIKKEVDKEIYNYFVKKAMKSNPNIDKQLLKKSIENISEYDKFLITMGEMYDNKEDITLSHKMKILAQTILLNHYCASVNLKFHSLLSVTKRNDNGEQEIKTQDEIAKDKQTAKKLLNREIKNAKCFSKWIIKNNFTVQTPGYDSRVIRPSDELCEHDYAKIEAKNMLNIKVWDEYIKLLVNTAKKVSPELLKTDNFLSREHQSFEKEKELA